MIRRLFLSLFISTSLAGLLFGEEASSGRGSDIVQLQDRITALEGDETVPEISRDAEISHLRDAIGFLEKKERFNGLEASYRSALSDGAEKLERMQGEVAALSQPQTGVALPSGISESSDMSQIEKALAQEQAALAEAKSALGDLEAEGKGAQRTPAAINDRMIAAQAELDEAEALAQQPKASGGSTVDVARETAQQSLRDSLVAEIGMLTQESLSYDIRIALSEAAIEAAKKRIELIEGRVQAIQKLKSARLSSGLNQAENLLRRVRESSTSANPSFAAQVQELERLISDTRRVTEQFDTTAGRLQRRQSLLKEISEDFATVERQIQIGGLEGSFARILLEKRRTLPSSLGERQILRKIREDLTDAQRTLYFLESGSWGENGDKAEDTSPSVEENGEVIAMRQELDVTRERLREDLAASYRSLVRELGELDLAERQINQVSAKYREFLSQQLFWERSSPVVGSATIRAIGPGLIWIFGPDRAKELFRQFSEFSPGFYVVLSVLLAALFGLRGKFRAALEASGNRTRRISKDNYLNTVKAFTLTILLALPIPLTLVAFGTAFRVHQEATEWSYGIGTAFLMIGAFMFVVRFSKEMAVEKGLGEYHFGWDSANLARLCLLFRRLVPIYIPSSLVLGLIVGESSPEHIDGMGRLVALLTVIGIGTVFIVFTKPKPKPKSADNTSIGKSQNPLLNGNGLFWFTIIFTAGLVMLLLVGFVLTTLMLIVELLKSFLAVYVAFIVHGMVLRWFEIRERRMALAEAIAERRARQEAAEEGEENIQRESEEVLIDEAEKDQGLSLVEVGEQMRNAIRFLIGVGLIAVLYYLWAKATPVLTGLAEIYIFHTFSIADLAVTTLVVGLTVSLTRNLPGLLEILVFRPLDVAPGTRTAVTTLVQYTVIAIGLLAVSRQIQIEWSQLGWIAAALSVGLGFGLQEVVANFVCGIILLFERPIRVGDVVTVNGVSGTVSRIQMRATTIVNWDCEELVVPNKQFITGSLLNTTLSNTINRIMIRVGVAYGSDTEKVLRILSEVARGTEGVMEDPAPMITFEAFGESSLDFTIRAYLPNRDNRLGVITEMHRQIDARFAECGIEIPFPQRDLHVRSVDKVIPLEKEPKS